MRRLEVLALLVILSRPVGFDDPNGVILPFLIVGEVINVIGGKLLGRFFTGLPERLEMFGRDQDRNRMWRHAKQDRRLIRLQNSRKPDGAE